MPHIHLIVALCIVPSGEQNVFLFKYLKSNWTGGLGRSTVSSSSLVNLLATKEQPHLSGDPPGVLGLDPCVDFHAACAYCDLRRRENQPATLQVLWIIGNSKILYYKHIHTAFKTILYLGNECRTKVLDCLDIFVYMFLV